MNYNILNSCIWRTNRITFKCHQPIKFLLSSYHLNNSFNASSSSFYSTSLAHNTSKTSKELAPVVFNRAVKRLQKDRAAVCEDSKAVDYLKDEIADRLVDRLLDIKRRFSTIVDLGSGAGHVVKYLERGMADKLIMTDRSKLILERDMNSVDRKPQVEVERKVMDEEALEFEDGSLECVLSNLSLHWVNDLPGSLIQIRRSLKPDGVFIGSMFGGDTLYELRQNYNLVRGNCISTSLQLAEMERDGGISPHVSPMADVKDMASLLQRAGFSLTTIDSDELVVNYPSMFELMNDIRSMGEANAVINRRNYLSRDVLIAADAIYKEMYGAEDGCVPATFQIIYMIGWRPDESQPKPKERGSATESLKNALTV